MRLIWVFGQTEYFSQQDWTDRFHLEWLAKFDFWRSGIFAFERDLSRRQPIHST
jgi:hypothetical protein